jgi:periplasmic protein TonB
MKTLSMSPTPWPPRTERTRICRVTGAVLLSHTALAWLLAQGWVHQPPPMAESDKVIMASVVMKMPASAGKQPQQQQTKPQVNSLPKDVDPTKTPPRSQTEPAPALQPQQHPTPVLGQAAPSDSAPIVPAAASAQQPTTIGNQRPNMVPNTAANTTPAKVPNPVVSLPSSDADYLNNPVPAYPRLSRRMGEQGTVLVRVLITPEGQADRAEIRTSSGHSRLDEAALDTVKRWRYVPGKRNGVAEAMWFNVPIRFVLD